MNKHLEHILLSDNVSVSDQSYLSDACTADPATAASVRNLVQLFDEVEKREIADRERSCESEFLEAWISEFPGVIPLETVSPAAVSPTAVSPTAVSRTTAAPTGLTLVSTRPAMRWVAAAAVIIGLGLFTYVANQPSVPAEHTVVADAGKVLVHELGGGSVVRISPGSSIGVADDGTINLVGSAFFSISPQSSSLKIVTANTTTEVIGTQFGIYESTGSTQIVMMEGTVNFWSNRLPDRSVRLGLNQASTIVGSFPPSQPAPVDILSALSWTDLIVFRSSSLEYVAGTLSARLGADIRVEDSIRGLTFTNTFRPEQGISEMLNTVALALNIDAVYDDKSGTYSLHAK